MAEAAPLEILKSAILLETRGKAFYQNAADSAAHESVKSFFQIMADEERQHIQMLAEQYKAYKANSAFVAGSYLSENHQAVANKVLGEDVKSKISGAGYEAAAISAAMLMEERAIALYSERAAATGDAQEKALYTWLADWEREHLAFLADIDAEVKGKIWDDNSFWPF
ncbi:MAG: ferritin family protein [Desulfosarcinaceae bacterium]|nr:ferritin family protein [Desulfosarcinaceae bacterium]